MAEKATRPTSEKKKITTVKPGKSVKKAASAPAQKTPPPRKPRRPATPKVITPVAPVVEFAPSSTVKGKPVFQPGTWLAVLIFAALIGFAFYLNTEKQKTAEQTPTPASAPAAIFAEDGAVTSIEIKPKDGETVKVMRNAENTWVVKLPLEAEADQGLAQAAAAQVSALQILNSIDADPQIFGLTSPAFLITIGFEGGAARTLEIGDTTPTNSGYYVRLDQDKMMITDLSGIDSLLQLGFFPPYLNTPVPASEEVTTPIP
jgi:hypothetical protein